MEPAINFNNETRNLAGCIGLLRHGAENARDGGTYQYNVALYNLAQADKHLAHIDATLATQDSRIQHLEYAIIAMAAIAADRPVGRKELEQIEDIARRALASSNALGVSPSGNA